MDLKVLLDYGRGLEMPEMQAKSIIGTRKISQGKRVLVFFTARVTTQERDFHF